MANNFIYNLRAARAGQNNNVTQNKSVSRGSMQKSRRTKNVKTTNFGRNEYGSGAGLQMLSNGDFIPGAPMDFYYKDPIRGDTDNLWRIFVNDDIKNNYDHLMYILDEASTASSPHDIYKYVNYLKGLDEYKDNENIQRWLDFLVTKVFQADGKKYDRLVPIDQMRFYTNTAMNAYGKLGD